MAHVTSVGLDVRARSIEACASNPLTGGARRRTFGYAPAELAAWILSLDAPKAACESGATGFHLQRELESMGVDRVIGAVSKMGKPAAEKRRKTDRRDAAFPARQLALGTVSEARVPGPEREAAHDMSRALADARDDVTASRRRLSKFLPRDGHARDETNDRGQRKRTRARDRRRRVESIRVAGPAAQETLDHCIDRRRRAIEGKRGLESKVKAHAGEGGRKPTADAPGRPKGIDVVAASALAVEADGFSRFRNASAYAPWLGPVPSERSGGVGRRRGGIAKSGNRHLRKPPVGASWRCLGASRHERRPRAGQEVEPGARRRAAKGVRRPSAAGPRRSTRARGRSSRAARRRAGSRAGRGP